jgi:hypothetical protein
MRECENKPETAISEDAPAMHAELPEHCTNDPAAKPKLKRKGKPKPAEGDAEELPPAPPGKLFADTPGLPD